MSYLPEVVSYRNSTSNHNIGLRFLSKWRLYLIEILHQTTTVKTYCGAVGTLYLIEILHQTTTSPRSLLRNPLLYLIEILHQTTTSRFAGASKQKLYLIEILHQTTTACQRTRHGWCCILSKFYIKPQPGSWGYRVFAVVSYRNSTSNHNYRATATDSGNVVSYRNSTSNHNGTDRGLGPEELYLIEILHQTTTAAWCARTRSKLYLIEILHQTTTLGFNSSTRKSLYLIEILHQTTTHCRETLILIRCILSKFYIKPQLARIRSYSAIRCILSKFYIKPQRTARASAAPSVVSYRNSTSNHNVGPHIDW